MNSVTTAVRGAMEKAADLMDSTHLHSLGDAGHEATTRVLAGTPDLTAPFGSVPADLHSLRLSTARRAHQLARSIDDRADVLAPARSQGQRWLKRLLVLSVIGAAAFYLSRKLTQEKTPSQWINKEPVGVEHEVAIADGSSTGATEGESINAGATSLGSKSSSNGARSKKADAK